MKYPKLPKDCNSLLAKYLTEQIFNDLKDKKTKNNFTLQKAIASGVENLDSGIGVYAGDKESYSTFSVLFDKIIEDYHGFHPNDKHTSNLNDETLIAPNLDNEGKYIMSTRIRVGRNVEGIPLGTAISDIQRDKVENSIVQILSTLEGELSGQYYPLLGMSKNTQEQLIKDHFLFKEGDRFLKSAGLNKNWPKARGIFHNKAKNFLVWVNEEDQLRIISMQKGGDIKEVFSRLIKAIKIIEEKITFSYNEHLGYITSCPTNLGTAMRASVHIKIPNLYKDMKSFKKITDQYFLQIRGTNGEHSQSTNGVYDISNKRRLGITEVEALQGLYNGVYALIQAEKELE